MARTTTTKRSRRKISSKTAPRRRAAAANTEAAPGVANRKTGVAARRPARRRNVAPKAAPGAPKPRGGAAALARAVAPGSVGRDSDLDSLHPAVRERIARVLERLHAEGLPFRVFEAYRTPDRQQYLYEQGRTRPGSIVTRAKAWESLHQYGLAADLVLFENNRWSWDDKGPKARWWARLKEIGREEGLEPLSWEAPHLQFPGKSAGALRSGGYPPGGDGPWADNLARMIYAWRGTPAAPPLPDLVPARPPLAPEVPLAADAALALPAPGAQGWHRVHGGREWRYDENGVYLRDHAGGREPLRTDGEPVTMRAIWSAFADAIVKASARHGVAPELIMTMIATEAAAYRKYGFTGPLTFRWEPNARVNDVDPPRLGDYSAGPMQVLGGTARWVIRQQRLAYDPVAVAPPFERQPPPPEEHPLYEAQTAVDIGAAVIAQRWPKSGDDPILVAACYNAGGVYASAANAWHVRCYGNHLDRAGPWYGDACAVLQALGVRAAPRQRSASASAPPRNAARERRSVAGRRRAKRR